MTSIGQRVRHIIGDSFGAAIVEQTIEKAIQGAKERASAPESTFYDPMSLFMGREWLNKGSSSLSFTDLRSMATNPIIGSIIQTRVNQVAAYCIPRAGAYDLGYEIKSDDSQAKADIMKTAAIRDWIANAGMEGYGEPMLETFARKFIRDSLILDQACAEIVNRRNGTPGYTVVVDAATIRKLRSSLEYATPSKKGEPLYAQVIEDVIVASYPEENMIFGVRNPQTEISYAGYGMSELEMLVRVVTTILNTEKYNSGQLTQGGTQKGILVVKGEIDNDQFTVFKRDFREAIRNASQYWRPPVLKVSKDSEVDWKTLDRSNRDMEYAQLFDFLVKQACGVYQIEPAEINWSIGATGASTVFESSHGGKVKSSRQRGLKPLLNFLGNQINTKLIKKVDPRYRLEFTHLEEDRKTDSEIREREVKTYKTINEQRAELNLPSLGQAGDIILDSTFNANSVEIRSGSEDLQDEDPKSREVEIEQELDS